MALKLTPQPETVAFIRKARQLTSVAVADAANMTIDLLAAVEREPTALPKGKVVALAHALAVPTQFLFFRNLRIEPNLPDFRTSGNRPAVLSSAGLARVERARSILSYLEDDIFDEDFENDLIGSVNIAGGVEAAAKVLQKYYVPVKRADGTVDPVATFRETRVAIEKEGAIVLCEKISDDGFRGFCFSEKSHFPLILINTASQRPATKLFTLMHEIVHVILGRTGISDPNILENEVERFCNKVTAAVMMPRTAFVQQYNQVSGRSVRARADAVAHHFGVSKSAAALRITELGLADDFYRQWLSALPPRIPQIEEEEEAEASSGGGGIGAQIGRFGYLLPSVLGKAVKKHSISIYDAYRLTNLAPKTLTELAQIGERKLEH